MMKNSFKQKCKKRKHKTAGASKTEANIMAEKFGVPFDNYYCTGCNAWHVGRSAKAFLGEVKKRYLDKNSAAIGIDPGKTGCLALMCKNHLEIHDFKGRVSSINLVRALNEKFKVKFAIVEAQGLWKKERSMKNAEVLVRNCEMWETILVLNKIKFFCYQAQTWRKTLVPSKMQNKPGYIKRAIEIFPEYEHLFNRHDEAEAALIAYRAFMHLKSGLALTL